MAKNKKKQFGDTKHFCPVSYKDNYVLWPGNPEVAAKYREKVYYFNNSDNRDLFLADPLSFVARGKPFVVSNLVIFFEIKDSTPLWEALSQNNLWDVVLK